MTSLSTMIAMLPLIIGNIGPGAGEGSRLAVGATIFGGMIISTFSLFMLLPLCIWPLQKILKELMLLILNLINN